MAELEKFGKTPTESYTLKELRKFGPARDVCDKLGKKFNKKLNPSSFMNAGLMVSCKEFGNIDSRNFGLELFNILKQKENGKLCFIGLGKSASEGLIAGDIYPLLETPKVYVDDGSCYVFINANNGPRLAPSYAFKPIL